MKDKSLELDAWIAEHVMGEPLPMAIGFRYLDGRENWGNSEEYTRQKFENYKSKGIADCLVWRPDNTDFSPTQQPQDALEVLKLCMERVVTENILISQREDDFYCICYKEIYVSDSNFCMAICRFAKQFFSTVNSK